MTGAATDTDGEESRAEPDEDFVPAGFETTCAGALVEAACVVTAGGEVGALTDTGAGVAGADTEWALLPEAAGAVLVAELASLVAAAVDGAGVDGTTATAGAVVVALCTGVLATAAGASLVAAAAETPSPAAGTGIASVPARASANARPTRLLVSAVIRNLCIEQTSDTQLSRGLFTAHPCA